MKYCFHRRIFLNLLGKLVLTSYIFVLTGADSFRRVAIELDRINEYVLLVNTNIPPLKDFTLCVDMNRKTNTRNWDAFSYRDPDNNDISSAKTPDLRWFQAQGAFKIYYLGKTFEFNFMLPLDAWHSLCSLWDNSKEEMDVYVNGSIKLPKNSHTAQTLKSKIKHLKGNGTLVLGINHIVQNGKIEIADSSTFLGNISNFQLWNFKRSPELLTDCASGNLVNWENKFWKVNEGSMIKDDSLRCANAKDELTTDSTTTHRTTIGNSAATTTSWKTQSESRSTATSRTYSPTSTSATLTSSKGNSTGGPPTKSHGVTTALNDKTSTGPTTPRLDEITTSESRHNTSSPKSHPPSASEWPSSSKSTPTTSGKLPLSQTSAHVFTSASKRTTSQLLNYTSKIPTSSITTSTTMDTISTLSTIVMGSAVSKSSTSNSLVTTPTTITTPTTNNSIGGESSITTHSSLTSMVTTSTTSTTTFGSPLITKSSTSATMAPTSTTSSTTLGSPLITKSPSTTTASTSTTSSTTLGSPLVTKSPSTTTTSTSTTSSTTLASPLVTKSSLTTTDSTSTIRTTKVQDSSNTKPPTSTSTPEVTHYVVFMNITLSGLNGSTDDNTTTDIANKLLDLMLKDTEFYILQFSMYNGPSNELWKAPSQIGSKKRRQTNEDSVDINNTSKAVIQAISTDSAESLEDKLKELLESPQYFEEVTLSITVNSVEFVVPGICPQETTYSIDKGLYRWMETNPSETAAAQCVMNSKTFGTRYCNVNIKNAKAEWEPPDLERCPSIEKLPDTIQEIEKIIVTPANAMYLALHISNLTGNSDFISEKDIEIILSKISEIMEMGISDLIMAQTTLDIINSIVLKGEKPRAFTNRILNLTEEIGFKMNFPGETASITARTLALSVTSVDFTEFENIFFTVKSYMEGSNPEITLQRVPADKSVAFIHLPSAIKDYASTNTSKVQFNFFANRSLFENSDILITYVVSASVENTQIQDLSDPVDITLKHISWELDQFPVKCVFWDFKTNVHNQNNASFPLDCFQCGTSEDGQGGWNTSGCLVKYTNENYTTCHCSHLTHFGVLLDISRSGPLDDHILSIVTYVGCGIASIFLGVALVTYLTFKQLRRDYPSKILMNLCVSLLMLNLVFLINSWLSSFKHFGLCVSSAAILHYFLLASFTWMGLEAVHMYFAFVKVFNLYIHNYILKFCIAGWGIPAVIVGIVLIIDLDFYGSGSESKRSVDTPDDSEVFCWIENNLVFYLTVVAYFCIIFLTNIAMFIVVLVQIKSLKFKKRKDWKAFFLHDIKSTLSLAFLLGLTWGFAFFAWGPVRIVFLYLFAIFNTLQGFFIFVFHCLMKENVRRYWRMHLCCGKFRLDNYSDWSKLSNAEARQNSHIITSPSDSLQSTMSNTTASTSNASSLSGFSRVEYTGNNYSNGGICINPAHLEPQNQPTMHPDTRRTLRFLNLNIK